MSSVLFLALQCCECSTMQVKQKKKSSNNWVCVICNQKQSVRRVFAQGYKAKDLRLFVQSFNMSRKVADEEKQEVADTFPEVEADEEVEEIRGKKRSDWSEYLDSDPPNERRRLIVEEDGEEEDLKIVTEIPNEMFKRPKLNRYSNDGGYSSAKDGVQRNDKEPLKPSFSRSCIPKQRFSSDGVMKRKKDTEQGNFKPARVTKPTSKWDAYLIDDEGEHQAARGASKDDCVGEWDRGITDVSYQIVDDEVHPDFM
ncbi:uncharacterized protein LOC103831685 isoform X1 [Brassica rapa]|uniref:MRN complex-interacting protein N-terminal domain-containing protein n=2 Tax=Brassica TaxID=3705 RepID=M4DHZ2_BRACM|nr:uncharacterized protein LOC103831685 isoform X1 [Brassica rapa]XP_013649502.1 uncharacterized protein BNAA07G29540D [Brassica napus]KAH0919959.1 hypothetical protein HID58_027619 [Brassica napus]CAF2196003.1 unnamed protein product [Brassica napus]